MHTQKTQIKKTHTHKYIQDTFAHMHSHVQKAHTRKKKYSHIYIYVYVFISHWKCITNLKNACKISNVFDIYLVGFATGFQLKIKIHLNSIGN